MEYNVVDSCWFNKIGIVKVVSRTGEQNLYIGEGDGIDQKKDEQKIAATGMKINIHVLVKFLYDRSFNNLKKP